MTPKQELKKLSIEFKKMKYPKVPVEFIPETKYKFNDANGLTAAVIDFIKFHRWPAWRINSMGVYDAKIKGYRTSNQAKGLPDIIAIVKGQFVGIEIKIGADKQSEHQKDREREIIQAGGLYWVIKDFDTFHENFKRII